MGKQQRRRTKRVACCLDLVHSDVCGPINLKSAGGNRYFLTFTNDYSGNTWVYLLKEEKEVLCKFREFKSLVKKQSGCHIKCIRTDEGSKYTLNEFEWFCKDNGIVH